MNVTMNCPQCTNGVWEIHDKGYSFYVRCGNCKYKAGELALIASEDQASKVREYANRQRVASIKDNMKKISDRYDKPKPIDFSPVPSMEPVQNITAPGRYEIIPNGKVETNVIIGDARVVKPAPSHVGAKPWIDARKQLADTFESLLGYRPQQIELDKVFYRQ